MSAVMPIKCQNCGSDIKKGKRVSGGIRCPLKSCGQINMAREVKEK